MTDIQKQLAEALEAVDKNAVKHCATEYSIDRETLLKVHQALAAHRQQEARGPLTWQPIETAPKDGTEIDLWCTSEFGSSRESNAYWKWGTWCQYLRDEYSPSMDDVRIVGCVPTHWMPLPPAPDAAHGIKGE